MMKILKKRTDSEVYHLGTETSLIEIVFACLAIELESMWKK